MRCEHKREKGSKKKGWVDGWVSRLGQQSLALKKKFVLPVKVTFANSTIVQEILRKSRHPRHHDQYKTVFISPDRSAHERAEHKRLVLELKEKAGQEPNKIYFIKEGQLCSKARVKNDWIADICGYVVCVEFKYWQVFLNHRFMGLYLLLHNALLMGSSFILKTRLQQMRNCLTTFSWIFEFRG